MTAHTKHSIDELFERRLTYPDFDPQERLSRLVGLDNQKARLTKILALLVNPAGLETWAQKHHPKAKGLLKGVLRRPPLGVLAGDVGSGKTELAETIGDAVARQEKIEITLFPLSLSSRGQGRVGEMTQLLSAAFDYTVAEATKFKSSTGRARGAVILLVDEADALAQSRESAQMHHEDRAGVNAFIRGIDRLGNGQLPVRSSCARTGWALSTLLSSGVRPTFWRLIVQIKCSATPCSPARLKYWAFRRSR